MLDLERVGVHDDFFALGGSSTHSLEVAVKANAANLPLRPESVFVFGTIAELAAEYGEAADDTAHLDEAAKHPDADKVGSSVGAEEDFLAADLATPVRTTGQPRRNTVIESIGAYLPGGSDVDQSCPGGMRQ